MKTNPDNPTETLFERYVFDDRIESEIHDMVTADIDGDGQPDIIAMGDGEGAFWYSVPENPAQDANWPRTTISMSVLDENEDIHSGFFPKGVGDLDILSKIWSVWSENANDGVEHVDVLENTFK